jgi:hypothetical protein
MQTKLGGGFGWIYRFLIFNPHYECVVGSGAKIDKTGNDRRKDGANFDHAVGTINKVASHLNPTH